MLSYLRVHWFLLGQFCTLEWINSNIINFLFKCTLGLLNKEGNMLWKRLSCFSECLMCTVLAHAPISFTGKWYLKEYQLKEGNFTPKMSYFRCLKMTEVFFIATNTIQNMVSSSQDPNNNNRFWFDEIKFNMLKKYVKCRNKKM